MRLDTKIENNLMKIFNVIAITAFLGAASFITVRLIKDSRIKYYSTTQIAMSSIEEKIHLSGYVYPSEEIEIKPQISGVVDAVYVKIGDKVREGDPIASVSLVPNASEVEQLTNAVNIAKINLSSAQSMFERQLALYEKKAISKVDYESAEKDYEMAKENYSTAVTQLAFRQKSKRTSHNVVRSSTSGVVIDIPVKTGSSVVERSNFNSGTTVATVAGTDNYVFRANVTEKSVARLRVGMPVKLSLLAYESHELEAKIVNISAKGESNGGAVKFPIEAEFSLSDRAIDLRSGYSATAEILLSRVESVCALPEKCINFKGDTTFVYVTDSLRHSARMKIVSIGPSDGDNVQIIDGVTPEDLVITNYHD